MKLSEYKNITQFLKDNPDFRFSVGEVGFGRPCLGILYEGNYVDYHIYSDDGNYETIAEHTVAYSQAPENAYHKHSCLAVLMHPADYDIGPSDKDKHKALAELDEWLGHIIEAGYRVRDYRESKNSLGGFFGNRRILKAIVDSDAVDYMKRNKK